MEEQFTELSHEWFDYSSKMWMINKRKHGQVYEYVCKKEKCKNKPFRQSAWCYWHVPPNEETPTYRSRRKKN